MFIYKVYSPVNKAGLYTLASMNPYLRNFWATPSRGKVLHGGRMSSKSWDTAANLVRILQTVKVRVLCTRMFQNKIDESVYALIKSQVERFGLSHKFEFQKSKIKCLTTGSEVFFYGLARNIDEIKSLEGIDILWIEEAHALTEYMWKILEPTIIRNEGSEIWVIFNPNLVTDFAYQRFVVNPPKGYLVRQINYDENPFLSNSALEGISIARDEDVEEFNHVYCGMARDNDDRTIIKRSWIMAAIDAHKILGIEISGEKRLGFDVADSGPDLNATCYVHGITLLACDKWKGGRDEMFDSCERVYDDAKARKAKIFYDSIGVGAGVGSNIIKLNEIRQEHLTDQEIIDFQEVKYTGWAASGKIINPEEEYEKDKLNKDMFANPKAQAWWVTGDRFLKTYAAVVRGEDFDPEEIISISSDCDNLEKLITELSTPFKSKALSGKMKVESKEDLAKRDIKSPNLADAFIMAYAPQELDLSFNWDSVK